MKIARSKLVPKVVTDEMLEALVIKGCKALHLRKYPKVIWIGCGRARGLYHQWREVQIPPSKKYIPCPGGFIEIWLPLYNSSYMLGAVKQLWHVVVHELAHYKDLGLLGLSEGYESKRRTRHDSRPCEIRAEDLVNECEGWQYASKEIMAIGLALETRQRT